MIQIQTKLKINDNSGIKLGQCIKIYKKNKKGIIGDTILISVKNLKLNPKKKIKIIKGDLFKAIIVHTKYSYPSTIGNYIRFDSNCCIILNNQNKLIGTRIFGPITSKFRQFKQLKILSLASHIL
jgi:large subunit ribosomal protein L14